MDEGSSGGGETSERGRYEIEERRDSEDSPLLLSRQRRVRKRRHF
jgi:hypothetical protein